MVVGEPTLMGGEFGDEDERLITRLENAQFEPNGENEDGTTTENNNQTSSGNPANQTGAPVPASGQTGTGVAGQFQNSPMPPGGWPADKKPAITPSAAPLLDEVKKE